jgi:hypothetical protein
MSGEVTTTITDLSHRQPSKTKFALIRVSVMASCLFLWPLVVVRAVEIEPFGKFEPGALLSVQRFLYDSEVTLGHLEQALTVAAAVPGRVDVFILQQVDCLVALGRREEAIALLERNLDIDGWRGALRRRLTELGGRHLRALN